MITRLPDVNKDTLSTGVNCVIPVLYRDKVLRNIVHSDIKSRIQKGAILLFSLLVIFPLLSGQNFIKAQNFKKIFGDIEKNVKLVENMAVLEKRYMKEPTNVLANYGLALIYKKSLGTDELFDSWFHIQKAKYFLTNQTLQDTKEVSSVVKDPSVILREYLTIDSLLWEKMKSINDLENLQGKFYGLEKSLYYDKYLKLRNALEYREAVKTGNTESLTRFINLYPDAMEIDEVIRKKDTLEFMSAREKDIIFVYNDFISKHPESLLLEMAVKVRDQKAYDLVKNSDKISDFDFFLHNYPNAPDLGEALSKRENLVFKAALEKNEVKSFQDFIHLYPRSSLLNEAVAKRDELVFSEIQRTSDYDSFRVFISGLPFAQTVIKTFMENYYKNSSAGNRSNPAYNF